jgi:glucose-1-phosphate cytidylyltransferase
MKVVLFCGGLGMRMRDYSEDIPKPMVTVGNKPILWNLMKYYAHFGHKDFILCLGYKAEMIKNYFLEYREAISNDFVFSKGGSNVQLLGTDIQDWNITFVDTGLVSNVGQRFMAVRKFLRGENIFLVNYTDVLTDMHLPDMISYAGKKNKIACLLSVRTSQRFHVVDAVANGLVKSVKNIGQSDLRINGGFYVFRKEIFDYIKEGEDLVEEPFRRLIRIKALSAFIYDGFWVAMDTFKDKQFLEDKYSRGETPWEVWKKP